ncbi:dCTP deaminase [Candidatus Woesearchaeota archaeon]|nr:dCTP deaminase [Candidatus Woesearchaeota archaeon]
MILTQKEILKEISKGRVKIEPFDKSLIGPASIDLTLSNKIRIFNNEGHALVNEDVDYTKITKIIDINEGYILKPQELVLGITKEKITLPDNICGWLNSRSRFARIGLMSHISAPFICPGVSNHQILEIFNASQHKIKLMPDVKICQLVLQYCKGNARYEGVFKDQML